MGTALESQRLVVIGASAGGLPALLELAAQLPASFPAPICVVLHIGAHPSLLPQLLSARGPLPARHPRDGEALAPGVIYVAPPDRHLLVTAKGVRISQGPKENHTRPAVDPLFRTAAVHWREAVIGVVLSGQLDDGSAGLRAIRGCGGMALVQAPDESIDPDMPLNALAAVPDAERLAPAALARRLVELVGVPPVAQAQAAPENLRRETALTMGEESMKHLEAIATPSTLTCPDCGGTLWALHDTRPERYRCHTGHAFTALSLESAQNESAEYTLRAAIRALHEKEMLLRRLAGIADTTGEPARAAIGHRKADEVRGQMLALRRMVEGHTENIEEEAGSVGA